MKTGIELIAEERERQITEKGWTAEHDDDNTDYELSQAAAYYCLTDSIIWCNIAYPSTWCNAHMKRKGFPFPTIRDLTKAGALIAAEIDRLQRIDSTPDETSDNARAYGVQE